MGGKKIRLRSRIASELPQEIRREIDRMLVEGGYTYDDIAAWASKKGFDISRSSIGRYGKGFLASYQRLRIVEDKSRALVSEAGEGMVLEEAASKIFAQMIIEAQLSGELDIKELPRIVSDFAKLQASSIMRERLKKDFRDKAKAVAEDVVKVAKQGGLSGKTAEEIRKKILGIV
jgi:hypothetical protein